MLTRKISLAVAAVMTLASASSYAAYATRPAMRPAPAVAPACSSPWYVSGHGGFAFTQPLNENDSDLGYRIGVGVGYQMDQYRFEAALTHVRSKFESKMDAPFDSLAATPLSIHNSVTAAMANVYYDMTQFQTSGLVPYLGAGVGYARVGQDVKVAGLRVNATTGEFAYQGIAGFSYNVDSNLTVFADYRYLGATKSNGVFNKTFSSHTANMGVRYGLA